MSFKIESVHLNEVIVVQPEVYGDSRGFFMETYRADQFRELGLPTNFMQDNHSKSKKGVLRGLHFQWDPPMGKLMRVTRGAAFLVAVDIRKGSPTLGKWFGVEVSEENKKQVWAPYGFARGFCSLGIYFADPEIGVKWPIDVATADTSDRDRNAQTLAQWLASPLSDNIQYQAKT